MLNMPNQVKEMPLYKELTVGELSRAGMKLYFYVKDSYTIFPMDGKFAVIVSESYDGESFRLLDELRIAQLLNIVGKDGWNKCYFKDEAKINN
ncbi:hypothetical protein ACFQ9Y_17010 [Peribacillus simplex]|uniref:hypothetical protein n=1 Tax=Peribacillus simplex TaxID=1478 RepID=UPI00366DA4E5